MRVSIVQRREATRFLAPEPASGRRARLLNKKQAAQAEAGSATTEAHVMESIARPADPRIARAARAAVLGVALLATAFITGCTLDAESSDESSDGLDEQTEQNEDALRQDGAHCQATCKSKVTGWTYRNCNYSISSGCHDWAVNACHNHGLSFVDAGWTHWGSC